MGMDPLITSIVHTPKHQVHTLCKCQHLLPAQLEPVCAGWGRPHACPLNSRRDLRRYYPSLMKRWISRPRAGIDPLLPQLITVVTSLHNYFTCSLTKPHTDMTYTSTDLRLSLTHSDFPSVTMHWTHSKIIIHFYSTKLIVCYGTRVYIEIRMFI